MRRVLFTVAATVLMAGAVPAAALAQHKHHRHHHRTHHARVRNFGDRGTATSTSASDNAGTVQSFQNGVLTIALNNPSGSTVSGMVTRDTELECTAPQQSSTMHDEGDGGSGDRGSGDDNQGSGRDDQGDNDQGEDQNEDQGEDQNEDQNENEANNCSTSNLTAGTVVHEARLRIGSSGAVWEKVELVS